MKFIIAILGFCLGISLWFNYDALDYIKREQWMEWCTSNNGAVVEADSDSMACVPRSKI